MKLSVLIITYNHQQFIGTALERVLTQRTEFDYEIVVGDDGSTDGTREIIERLQTSHPDQIRALPPSNHRGIYANFQSTYERCRGEYVALLDGDDYWTSPTKLQQQSDFLDRHADCVLCFHGARVLDERKGRESSPEYDLAPTERKEHYGLEDILLEQFVPQSAVVFRNGLFDNFPESFSKLPVADWLAFVWAAQHGWLGYIDTAMSVYRRHDNATWATTSHDERIRVGVALSQCMNEHLGFKYDRLIRTVIARTRAYEMWDREVQQLREVVEALAAEQPRLDERIRELGMESEETARLYQRIQEMGERDKERVQLYARVAELGRLAEDRETLYARVRGLCDERADLVRQVQTLETQINESPR